jgi:hypothetical protein
VAQADPRELSARPDATFVALATVTTSAVAPPATLTGPAFVADSASALRAIGRAITPLQVSAAGATDFTYVSKRTASQHDPPASWSPSVADRDMSMRVEPPIWRSCLPARVADHSAQMWLICAARIVVLTRVRWRRAPVLGR